MPCNAAVASSLCLWLWALAAPRCAVEAHGVSEFPPCRKSPELHSLTWPDGKERLVAYGGKGFDWVRKGGKKGKNHEEAVELLGSLNATRGQLPHAEGPFTDDEINASSIVELAGKGKLKRKAMMLGDTWVFDEPSGGWQRVALQSVDSPMARWKHSGCRVDARQAMVIFGGDETTAESGMLNDLWMFEPKSSANAGGTWSQFFTVNPPRRRRGHVTACNATHIVVIGGKSWTKETGTIVNTDVWALPLEAIGYGAVTAAKEAAMVATINGSAGKVTSLDASLRTKNTQLPVLSPLTWMRGADFPGAPRWGATGTLLRGPTGLEFLAFFGGRNKNHGAKRHAVGKSAYTYYNELWLYNFQANSWSKANVRGSLVPQPRDHHGATDLGGDLYVFGGRVMEMKTRKAVANDLWSYSLSTESWTLHEAVGAAPIPRFMPGVASVGLKGESVLIIFGGETLPGSTKKTSMNDVWVYQSHGKGKGHWSELSPSKCSVEAVAAEALAELAAEEEGSRASAWLLFSACTVALLAFLAGVAAGPLRRRLGGSWPLLLRPLRSSLLADNRSSKSSAFPGEQVSEPGYVSID